MRRAKILANEPIKPEDGVKIACRVIKNRLSKKNPYTTCEYYAIYGVGIDSVSELPEVLVTAGIIRRAGAYHYWERNNEVLTVGGVECKFKSKTAFADAIRENEELRNALVDELNKQMTSGKVATTSLTDDEIAEIKANEAKLKEELDVEDEELED